jgi:hypothetical protein
MIMGNSSFAPGRRIGFHRSTEWFAFFEVVIRAEARSAVPQIKVIDIFDCHALPLSFSHYNFNGTGNLPWGGSFDKGK